MTPRTAIYRGERVRVLNYVRNGVFRCLDPRDTVRFLHSSRLTFLP